MRLFLFIAATTISVYTSGQNMYFRHYQVEEGLSNNTIICSLQDKKGFLWFGTGDGLHQFDGHTFKIFRHDKKNPTTIGSNSITFLHENIYGKLWAGTSNGIYYYDAYTEQFFLLKNSLQKYIRAICSDKNYLWFVEDRILYRYNYLTKNIDQFIGINNVSTLYQTHHGILWIGTENGLIASYNNTNKSFSYYVISDNIHPHNSIEKIYAVNNDLFIGTSKEGLKRFDYKKHTYQNLLEYDINKTEIFVRDIKQYDENNLWVVTENGLYIYDINNNTFTHIKKNYLDPYSISDNALYTVCRDKEGGMWIGSYFGGINYYPNQIIQFEKFFPNASPHAITGNVIREITQDDRNNIWIGTEDEGLNKYNPYTKTFINYKPDTRKGSISYTNIHALLADNDRLFIGTFEHGLDIMDLSTEKVIQHYNAGTGEHDLKSNYISTILKTKNNKIYIGTSAGIYLFNNKYFTAIHGLPTDIFYSAVIEDAIGRIWIGTHTEGLFYLYQNKIRKLRILVHGNDILKESRIVYLTADRDKQLWIATEAGIYVVDSSFSKVKIYNIQTGIPSNIVYTISQDSLKNMWITSSKGLVRIDYKTQNIKIFKQADGLINDQFNHQSAFIDKDGFMYFGSVKGLIKFNPYSYHENTFTPPLYLTGFQIFNKDVSVNTANTPLQKSISLTDHIKLKYNQSTFSIDFAALSYTSPENIEYAYKMEGVDYDWNYTIYHRAYFTNLTHGKYIFHIKSTNSSGTWKPNEKILTIEILPPWWKNDWVYLLYIVIIGSILYLIAIIYMRRQVNKQKREMEQFERTKEKEAYESKINFFTKIAHEIRTPLTLIKAPMEKILYQVEKFPQIQKYLLVMNKNTERLLELTNQLLDFRKMESEQFALNFTEADIIELTRNIWNQFQSIAEHKNLKFNFTNYSKNENQHATIDREAFTKIMSNLFDNAVKYAHSTILTTINLSDNYSDIVITVSNDGRLISSELHEKIFEPFFRSKETDKITGTGIGLTLARSLTELHKGSLTLTTDGKFNTFILKIPVTHN